MFRLGQDFVVRRDEAVGDAIAVFGDVVVEGQVCENLSVTLGNVRLVRGAVVHGSVVVVGGTLTIEPGVVVDDELVLVGGVAQVHARVLCRRARSRRDAAAPAHAILEIGRASA